MTTVQQIALISAQICIAVLAVLIYMLRRDMYKYVKQSLSNFAESTSERFDMQNERLMEIEESVQELNARLDRIESTNADSGETDEGT